MGAVTDALLISARTDETIYVGRSNRAYRKHIRLYIKQLKRVKMSYSASCSTSCPRGASNITAIIATTGAIKNITAHSRKVLDTTPGPWRPRPASGDFTLAQKSPTLRPCFLPFCLPILSPNVRWSSSPDAANTRSSPRPLSAARAYPFASSPWTTKRAPS